MQPSREKDDIKKADVIKTEKIRVKYPDESSEAIGFKVILYYIYIKYLFYNNAYVLYTL